MLKAITLVLMAAIPSTALAQETAVSDIDTWRADPTVIQQGGDIDLASFKWIARPILVFADSPYDPRFVEQMELLSERMDELVERDMVIIVDTDPTNPSSLRDELHPSEFSFVLIGKDGDIKLRKPFPWDVRELTRIIDKMPMRQLEISKKRSERAVEQQ